MARYVTDRHVRFNVTLRFLTLRYITWKTRISETINKLHWQIVWLMLTQ